MTGRGFLEHTLNGFHRALEQALSADRFARRAGILQSLDPRVKLAGVAALIVAVALAVKLWVVAAAFAAALLMAAVLSIPFSGASVAALVFSGALAVPALFLTPGAPIYRVPALQWEITRPGLVSACFLILRAEIAVTLAMMLVFTTPWAHILKALRMFRVPVVFVVILGMTSRYILLLLETAQEMFESRKSRTVGALTPAEQRRISIQTGGALLSRTFHLSGEVFLAMQARGFRGEVYVLDDFRMRRLDWIATLAFAVSAILLIWAGR